MKKTTKIVIGISIGLLVIIAISKFCFLIDSERFQNGKEPLFILKSKHFSEGGTVFHYGPGYQLIDWHVAEWDKEKDKSYYYTKKEVLTLLNMTFKYEFDPKNTKGFTIVYE